MVDKGVINNMIPRHKVENLDQTLANNGKNQATMRKKEDDSTPLELPKWYQKWTHMFTEKEGKANLPEHQPWDHTIDLEEGKTPPFGPLYPKSGEELQKEH